MSDVDCGVEGVLNELQRGRLCALHGQLQFGFFPTSVATVFDFH